MAKLLLGKICCFIFLVYSFAQSFAVLIMQREKQVSLDKFHMLEQQLDVKLKLELEIKQMQGKLQSIKHMRGDEDSEIKKKMDELGEELQDKYDAMESLVQTLIIKERVCNDELQDAQKALISVSYLILLIIIKKLCMKL